jgi:Flp pilus assembly protein TadD
MPVRFDSRPAHWALATSAAARCKLARGCAALLCALGLAAGAAHAETPAYKEVQQLLRAGQWQQAQQRADAYLASNAKDPQMRFLKGVAQNQGGQGADAQQTFTQLTQDYPELPEPYNNLAVLHAAQNQLEQARAALDMAIRLNPDYGTAHQNLGDVYTRLAAQAYARAVALDSSGNPALRTRQQTLQQLTTPPANAAARK